MDAVAVAVAYAPGDLLCVVAGGTLIVANLALDDPVVPVVRDLCLAGAPVFQLLNALAAERSWAELPPFAAIQMSDPVLALVRGDVGIVVRTAQGDHRVDGRDVLTWVESRLPRGLIEVGDGAAATASPLQLERGVAQVSGIVVQSRAGGPIALAVPAPIPVEARPAPPQPRTKGHRPAVPEVGLLPEPPGSLVEAGRAEHADVFPMEWADRGGTRLRLEPPPPAASAPTQLRPRGTDRGHDAAGVPAVLHLSTGERLRLEEPLVIGRGPWPPPVVDGVPAQPVQVPSPDNQVSRCHVQVTCRGRVVYVTDLGSQNGTTVKAPGALEQEQLQARVPRVLQPGATVYLADEVSFTLEAAP